MGRWVEQVRRKKSSRKTLTARLMAKRGNLDRSKNKAHAQKNVCQPIRFLRKKEANLPLPQLIVATFFIAYFLGIIKRFF